VHVNFNLPSSIILLIINHISVLYIALGTFILIFSSTLFPIVIMHFYEVLYISVKEEISFSKVYR
jgi:hypothetical protein